MNGISEHYKAVISLQLIVLGILLAGLWIYWRVDQPMPMFGALIANALVSVYNTIQVMSGTSENIISLYKFKR